MPTQAEEARQSAFNKAAHFSDLATLTRLVKKGVTIDATDGEVGNTALMMAATNALATNQLDCLKLLIANGANVNAQSDDKFTALHFVCNGGDNACAGGKASIVELLLKAGADASLKDEYGRTALDLAKRNIYCRMECIKLIENPPVIAAQAAKKAPAEKAKKPVTKKPSAARQSAVKKAITKKTAAAKTSPAKQLAKKKAAAKKPAASKKKS
jgi:ankyrin repeat protein